MGANQSGQQGNDESATGRHGITVVNPSPRNQTEIDGGIVLPARVPPILNIDGNISIDHKRHKPEFQLNKQLWIDFVTTIDKLSNSRADLVAMRQSQLQEKITIVDDHVQRFTDIYINDKHKALAQLNDDFRKMDEINKTLDKCTIQSELCVDMLNKLNFLLPEEHKLEPLEA